MGVIQRQGIKNAIFTYSGIILGFINIIFIQPNYLTKEEIGLVRVLFSFSALIAVFLPLGMNISTIRYFPYFKNPDKRHHGYFGFMLLFPLAGLIIFSSLLMIFKPYIIAYYIEKSSLFTNYFSCLIPYILILGLISTLHSYAFALLKTTVPSFINDIIVRSILILLTIAYFMKWFDLSHYVYYTIGIYGLQMLFILAYIYYEDRPGLKIDYKFLKGQNPAGIIKYGITLSFAATTSLGLKYIDTIILGHYRELAVVGIYAIAAFIPTVIEAPLSALDKIGAPKISQAYATDNKKEIKDIYCKSAKYMLLLGGLLFLGVNINIKYLFMLTPRDFASGINVVLIISVGTLINMATGLNDPIVFNSKKYIYGTYMLIMLFVLAIVNNMIFIPIFGMEGAAFATCLSSFIYNTVKYFFIWKNFKLQPFDRFTVLTILLIVFCLGVNYFLPGFAGHPLINMVYRSVIITCIYGFGTYFFKIVPEFHHYIPFIKKAK